MSFNAAKTCIKNRLENGYGITVKHKCIKCAKFKQQTVIKLDVGDTVNLNYNIPDSNSAESVSFQTHMCKKPDSNSIESVSRGISRYSTPDITILDANSNVKCIISLFYNEEESYPYTWYQFHHSNVLSYKKYIFNHRKIKCNECMNTCAGKCYTQTKLEYTGKKTYEKHMECIHNCILYQCSICKDMCPSYHMYKNEMCWACRAFSWDGYDKILKYCIICRQNKKCTYFKYCSHYSCNDCYHKIHMCKLCKKRVR